jgi:hypothetical protein
MSDVCTAEVAVIVVHGVAEQTRGDTAAAVAAQLAATTHASVERTEVLVDTPEVQPAASYDHLPSDTLRQRMAKSLLQSVRSDFLGTLAKHKTVRATHDEGVLYTDYLIEKARSVNGTGPRVYGAPCFRLRGSGTPLDVFEMYWADRSRLTGFITRIATELFTLLFHLSKLGTDAIALAAHLHPGNRSLRVTSRMQRLGDWTFSRVLALLSLQLVVCVLLLLPRALLQGHRPAMLAALAVLALLLASALVYRGTGWLVALVAGVVAAGLVGWWIGSATDTSWRAPAFFNLAWAAAIVVAHERFLRYAEERFRAVLGVGRAMLAVTLAFTLAGFLARGGSWDGWVIGALMAVEAVLLGYVIGWIVFACAIGVSVVASKMSTRHSDPAQSSRIRQTVVTGQLGLYVSTSAFLAAVMTLWAIVETQLKLLVDGLTYAPWHFSEPYAKACAGKTSAFCFIEDRFTNSTENFAFLVLAMLVLVGFIALVMLPSVLVELRIVTGLGRERLGVWLTSGFKAIDRLVRWWSVLSAALALAAAAVLLDHLLRRLGLPGVVPSFLVPPAKWLPDDSSQKILTKLVYWLTGGAAGILALGSVAIKQIRSLRAPLDVALDVDKHFREFPRKAIPRVEIIERYIGLLRHVCGHYKRIVIVAHSQGTVITTELLRYLCRRSALVPEGAAAADDMVARLARKLDGMDVRLLTVGCPLRQLYALRFPWRYDWVLRSQDSASIGPSPRGFGVCAWSNVWGTGDYVGRWLWSPATGQYPLSLQPPACGYAECAKPEPGDGNVRDVNLGSDAHTHYFELDQPIVVRELAWLVDRPLVAEVPKRDGTSG